MSIFPPLLDIIKDLSNLIQCFINFLCVHLPGIVCMTGKLEQASTCSPLSGYDVVYSCFPARASSASAKE